jgi:hypothetical protein
MSQTRRLAATAALFAVTVALVALAAALHTYGPLFGAWVPLVTSAWVLSRRDPGYVPPPPARPPTRQEGPDEAATPGTSPDHGPAGAERSDES